MKACIITIGDELLIGQVINTNSAWMASELTAIGFTITNHVSISDRADHIHRTIDRFLPENDLLIITGGLGPTNDDITKKVLAEYFDSALVLSEPVLTHVEALIKGFGAPMNDLNRQQALVPENAKVLFNNHGTAPGLWFEREGRIVISLPGVPREMKGIYSDCIRSTLIEYFSLPEIVYRTVMLTGIGESHLAQKLENWETELPRDISLAYLPSPGQIRLRLGAAGNEKQAVLNRLQKEIDRLHEVVPKYIYGYDEQPLEAVVGAMIAERGGFLAAAESCTGGAIASSITALPGCSAWFKGGVVAYSNEIKEKVLGVKAETLETHGAVSGETIEEMVIGALRIFNAEYAVATSGIAGPDGGTPDKPVGTVWIAAAGPGFLEKRKFTFGKDRALNILRSRAAAFNMIRKAMLKN